MKIQKIYAVYFSPTGNTKNVVMHLAKYFTNSWVEIDLTNPHV